MQKLLCCLLGFDEPALRTLRGLARLFRPSLTADWEFTDGWQEGCVILLCNLDDPSTRDLWVQGSLSDLPLAVATSAPETPDGWVLRKPLRGQGPNGLVHVLNEAASGNPPPRSEPVPAAPVPSAILPEHDAGAGRSTIVPFPSASGGQAVYTPAGPSWPQPGAGRPGSAVAATGGLPALAKSPQQEEPDGAALPAVIEDHTPIGLAEPLPAPQEPVQIAAPPAPESRMIPPPAAEPAAHDTAEPAIPPPPEATEQAPEPAPEVEAPAQAAEPDAAAPAAVAPPPPSLPAEAAGTPEPAPHSGVSDALTAALSPASFVPHASTDVAPDAEGMQVNVVPVSDLPSSYGTAQPAPPRQDQRKVDEETALRDRLRNLHARPEPEPDTQQDDFLALLNRLYRVRAVGIVQFDELPPFCVVPTESAYYGRVTLTEIAERLRENPVPREVRIATSLTEGMAEIDARGLPPGQIRELFWLANLRCPNAEQVARFEQGAYRLRRWPDLTQLPHERPHVNWCGLVARRPVTLQALASVTAAPREELAAFLAGCAALGILEAVEVTAEAQASAPTQQTAKSRERVSVFRSLLNRLGFRRS